LNTRTARRLIAATIFISALWIAPTADAKSPIPDSAFQAPVTEVGPTTKATMAVFRKTDPPVAVPDTLSSLYNSMFATRGQKTLHGLNVNLAQPSNALADQFDGHVWLIPGADEFLDVYALNSDGAFGGSIGNVSDKEFQNHGWVVVGAARSGSGHWQKRLLVVVPDSTTIRVTLKRRGRKALKRGYIPQENVLVLQDSRAAFVTINGKKTDVRLRARSGH
jgi:hypothetical protein